MPTTINFEADKGSRYDFSGVARKHRILAGKSYNIDIRSSMRGTGH